MFFSPDPQKKYIELHVYVTTHAKKIHIGGLYDIPEKTLFGVDQALKIRLTALPIKGKANEQAQEILSKTFMVKKSSITLISGAQSRLKIFCIPLSTTLEETLKKLAESKE